MHPAGLATDDAAVSGVVGVVLMVAITVVVAAVVGAFALGLGSRNTPATPRTQFSFDFTDAATDELEITHETGNAVDADNVVIVSATDVVIEGVGGTPSGERLTWGDFSGTDAEVSVGDSVRIRAAGGGDLNGEEILVVWEPDHSSKTTTMARWDGA